MLRAATISTVAFFVFANPSMAGEEPLQKARRVAALIGEPSADPSARGLVVELQTRGSSEPYVMQAPTSPLKPSLFIAGPYGAWDLDAPLLQSSSRFSVSGPFSDMSSSRFDANPLTVANQLSA